MIDIALSSPELSARVKPGLLFRGGIAVSSRNLPNNNSLVIDLRSTEESLLVENNYKGAKCHCPLSEGGSKESYTDWARRIEVTDIEDEVIKSYQRMLKSNLVVVRRLYEEMADTPYSIYVHCSAGKDRTGVVIACLLRMLGMSYDAIMCDYMFGVEVAKQRRKLEYVEQFNAAGLDFSVYSKLVFPSPIIIKDFIKSLEKEHTCLQNYIWNGETKNNITIFRLKEKILL